MLLFLNSIMTMRYFLALSLAFYFNAFASARKPAKIGRAKDALLC